MRVFVTGLAFRVISYHLARMLNKKINKRIFKKKTALVCVGIVMCNSNRAESHFQICEYRDVSWQCHMTPLQNVMSSPLQRAARVRSVSSAENWISGLAVSR